MFFHGIFLPWVRRAGAWLFWPALAVVAWGELTPHPPTLPGPWLWDKLDHFTAYFGLMLLSTLGWGLRRSLVWVFLAVVVSAVVCVLLEERFLRGFKNEFGGSVYDVYAVMVPARWIPHVW